MILSKTIYRKVSAIVRDLEGKGYQIHGVITYNSISGEILTEIAYYDKLGRHDVTYDTSPGSPYFSTNQYNEYARQSIITSTKY